MSRLLTPIETKLSFPSGHLHINAKIDTKNLIISIPPTLISLEVKLNQHLFPQKKSDLQFLKTSNLESYQFQFHPSTSLNASIFPPLTAIHHQRWFETLSSISKTVATYRLMSFYFISLFLLFGRSNFNFVSISLWPSRVSWPSAVPFFAVKKIFFL